MLVRRFLNRLSEGEPAERADIVAALVRVYREAPLDPENRAAAAMALTAILDDPSARVRRALAEGLADCADAPRAIVLTLAEDQPDVARPVLGRSAVLREADLIDLVGALGEPHRVSIAGRAEVGIGLAAAIVELSGPDACLALMSNPGARVAGSTFRRLVDRHRRDPGVRAALLARDDVPVTLRQLLIDGLSDALGDLLRQRRWLAPERTERLMREARERAAVDLAHATDPSRLRPLVEQLAGEGRLTPALVLRAACVGNTAFFLEALSVLSGMPLRRVASLVRDGAGAGFPALYRRTRLPAAALPAMRAVVATISEMAPDGAPGAAAMRGQRMIERILTHYHTFADAEVDEFFTLLGRLSAEAAREEARVETGGYFRAA